jgi:hypothetical protein
MKKVETKHLLTIVEKMKLAHEAKLKELAIHDKNVLGWLDLWLGGDCGPYLEAAKYMKLAMGISVDVGSGAGSSTESEFMRATLEGIYYRWRSNQLNALLGEYLDLISKFPTI